MLFLIFFFFFCLLLFLFLYLILRTINKPNKVLRQAGVLFCKGYLFTFLNIYLFFLFYSQNFPTTTFKLFP